MNCLVCWHPAASWDGGSSEGQISPLTTPIQKWHRKQLVSHTFSLKNWWDYHFYPKNHVILVYLSDVLWGIDEFWKFMLFKGMSSYTCSKFRKSYMSLAARIRVNILIHLTQILGFSPAELLCALDQGLQFGAANEGKSANSRFFRARRFHILALVFLRNHTLFFCNWLASAKERKKAREPIFVKEYLKIIERNCKISLS
jgi:hypothetical protein